MCSAIAPSVVAAASALAVPNTPMSVEPLLQFTAKNHILAFRSGDWALSNGSYALRIGFLNASPVTPHGAGATGPHATPSQPTPLQRAVYPDLWPGITLTYRAVTDGVVESVYQIAPHADPTAIRLCYNTPVSLNADGSLSADFETGQVVETAPVAWQMMNQTRQPIAVKFELHKGNIVSFAFGTYDPGAPLYVDPTLKWNTFLGGTGQDSITGIALDNGGNAYVSGHSDATWGTPKRAYCGGRDIFVAKIKPNGQLKWLTFLGSAADDRGNDLALDSSGHIYATGASEATWGTPKRPYVGYADAFVAKLTPTGMIEWNTFLGGTSLDSGVGITLDESGNAYIAGYSLETWGAPKRLHRGGNDAFAAKVDMNGELAWNTFLGGSDADSGSAIVLDPSGNSYVTGQTSSTWGTPKRAFGGGVDAFVAKLNPKGGLVWNTFLGGSSADSGSAIARDADGHLYVAGWSSGTWGTPKRAHSDLADMFVAMLMANGTLNWNTFLGGYGVDSASDIMVNSDDEVYVTGGSDQTWGQPEHPYSGDTDGVVAGLSSTGVLEWLTFVGGSGYDFGTGIELNKKGNILVVGPSEATWGSPVRAYTGDTDGFVALLK